MRFRKRKQCQEHRGNGKCRGHEALNLASLAEGQEAVIASVPDLPLLPPLGLRPGKKIRVQSRGCCGGPIFAEVERRCIALGRCLAREVQLLAPEQQVSEELDHETLPTLTATSDTTATTATTATAER